MSIGHILPALWDEFAGSVDRREGLGVEASDSGRTGGGGADDGADQESFAEQIGAGTIECGAVGEGVAKGFQNSAGADGRGSGGFGCCRGAAFGLGKRWVGGDSGKLAWARG